MKKILVVGDSCNDVYTYCHSTRLAPDKPVPVLEIDGVTTTPGMAMNVLMNVESLHKNVDIITNPNWQYNQKNRYVDKNSNHMFMRVDTSTIIERIDTSTINYNEYDTIIISDYNKGFLTEEDIEEICTVHSQVFLDTKKVLGSWSSGAKYIKINNYEYERSKKFIKSHIKHKVIQTMGSKGCSYCGKIYSVEPADVIDVSGAGDTFMASLCVKYTQTGDISTSIDFANMCASKVVRKKGTSII